MYFFYLDESGCTGERLDDRNQRIFVLGGISLRDKGWDRTLEQFGRILSNYFGDTIPGNFELHASDLLSSSELDQVPALNMEQRKQLAKDILNLLGTRKHNIHFFAIDKQRLSATQSPAGLNYGNYNLKTPYLVAYDYLLTHIYKLIKSKLSATARGMFIIDIKEQFHDDIEAITEFRRFENTATHRIKRIVEFSYPVDSKKNPMIQFCDLIVFCIKQFLEIESGYSDHYPPEVKQFYAECYKLIDDRNQIKTLVKRQERGMGQLNDYLEAVQAKPRTQWKRHYNLT